MDQLKPIIDAVKKYHFWVICGAVLLTVLVCWWMATGGLAAQYKQQASKIKGDFTAISGIPADHPNQANIDEIKKKHEALKKNVYDAWENLYREQKEKNPFPTDVLGENFRRQFESLRPQEELALRYRGIYQNYIQKYIPKLKEKVDALRPIEGAANVAGAGALGAPRLEGEMGNSALRPEEQWTGVVAWNESDYGKLLNRFQWDQVPTTLEVVMAQEDLWVYEALLGAIKNVNEGADNPNNASIKKIEALDLGKDAVAAWKNSENALGILGQGDSGKKTGTGGGFGDEPGGPHGGGKKTDGPQEEQIKQQLFESRYIDEKGTPLPYQPQYPYVKHPYAEFKMMPIRMSLTMDQRKIPALLTNCANSNMPIEVRRLRLLKSEAKNFGGGGGQSPGRGRMGGGEFGMEGMGYEGGHTPRMGTPLQETAQLDVPVEIHAIIYIYNPPDREKLGTGAAATPTTPPTATGGTPE
ncbi:MAG: hypothetical protein JW959_04780 [Pirellulales bacterium]|nr:hypothetical protein [Pirellulales bacterium]